MNRIGIDLAKLIAGEPLPDDFAPDCPGARVRVTRQDLQDMIRDGERFITQAKDLPVDGYGDARVRCSNPVPPLLSTCTKTRQFYGLCHSCSGLEADNRAALRHRQNPRGRQEAAE